ncbi:MAG: NAD(P)-binding domain-containing protein [Alistipes sp.]|jgi:glycerol-3-phosphate dehydrogenase (NAD(P)+)|nr:NAD(P)-binding domain-containing protein [Alistipes sp.]
MNVLIDKEARCAVVGHGSWATGLVKILTDSAGLEGGRVGWFVRNPEVLESLRSEGRNPRYLSDVEFDTRLLELSGDIDSVVAGADVVILAAPSAFIKSYLEGLRTPLSEKFVISAIKGIVPGNYLSVTEYLERTHGLSLGRAGVIGGPSHAEEIALERLSYLTVACDNLDNARIMTHKLSARYIHTTISDDIRGVEYAAILKNIYALSVGIATGLGYGDNFLSVLISNGAREMRRFLDGNFPCAGRDTDTSAFLGDLLVTAYSPFSRNRRFGMMIGKGLHVKVAQMELGGVAEGYYASETVRHVNASLSGSDGSPTIEMPIAEAVYDILYGGAAPSKTMRNLTNKLI